MTDPKLVLTKLQATLAKPHMDVGWPGSHWLQLAISDCQKLVLTSPKDKSLSRPTLELALAEVNAMIDELVALKEILDRFSALSISVSNGWKLTNKHATIKYDLYNRKGILTAYLAVV